MANITSQMRAWKFLRLMKKASRLVMPESMHERIRYLAIDFYHHITMSSSDVWYEPASKYIRALSKKKGLEIGGPSWVFKTKIPVYRFIKGLDNVNWAACTVNNPPMKDGRGNYKWYLLKKGRNFIAEADQIPVDDGCYDFVISSQVLEHIANPLKTLIEWKRVTKKGGYLVCLVPRSDKTFDHKRSITRLDHILEDFESRVGHDDLTHVEAFIALVDFRDLSYKTKNEFEKVCRNNPSNRLMHHHVFDLELLSTVVGLAGYRILNAETVDSGHIVLAQSE